MYLYANDPGSFACYWTNPQLHALDLCAAPNVHVIRAGNKLRLMIWHERRARNTSGSNPSFISASSASEQAYKSPRSPVVLYMWVRLSMLVVNCQDTAQRRARSIMAMRLTWQVADRTIGSPAPPTRSDSQLTSYVRCCLPEIVDHATHNRQHSRPPLASCHMQVS
jgi:hypothetical protein